MLITDAAIKVLENAENDGRDRYIFDSAIRGFYAKRNHTSGRITFGLQYKLDGRNRRYTIGKVGLDLARKMAKKIDAKVVLGEDPASEKLERRRAVTFEQLADEMMEQQVRPRLKQGTVTGYEYLLRKHLKPAFGTRKVAGVQQADITRLHERLRDTPAAANRCVRLLHKLFAYAERMGYRPLNSNPAARVELYKETRRKRYLSTEELTRLGVQLKKSEQKHPSAVLFVRLALLTGCRKREILGLRWEDVDLSKKELHLQDAKRGPRTVHLGAPAVLLLSEVRERSASEWVCPGRDGEMKRPDEVVKKIFDAAGLEDFRIHDLRHSFGSIGVSDGLSLPIVGALLGHANAASTERYSHLADAPVKLAADQVTEELAKHLAAVEN